jgi:hypothetical protein
MGEAQISFEVVPMRRFIVPLLLVVSSAAVALAVGCTDQTNPPFGGGHAASDSGGGTQAEDSATSADTSAADAPSGEDAGVGSGTIAGSVAGAPPFTTVMSAYWIGVPDVAGTTAVYLVGKQLACADITTSGWAHTITAGTPIFEMIMATKMPATGTYTVSTAASPPVGSAEVQYVVAGPTRNETRATAGTIDLTKLIAQTEAVGTFNVQFGAGDGGAGDGGDAGTKSSPRSAVPARAQFA